MTSFLTDLQAALAADYRVDRELGAGGMATVYLAHDIKHDRAVALKVLKPELAASIGAERFLKEIRLTANLRHPHIVPLYDSGMPVVRSTTSCRCCKANRSRCVRSRALLRY
jgi:serine/threonine-protein kinase